MTLINLIPPIYINVLQYPGVDLTGAVDSTAGIASARAAANAAGGGVVYYPPGTYLSGNQTFYSNVIDMGAGVNITTIKLKNGVNTDLFSAYASSINLSASPGTGSATGVIGAGLFNLTLDGNKANQSSGTSYIIRGYGYAFTLGKVEIKNGFTGGILWDWNNTADPAGISVINHWSDVECHDNNGIGIQIGGPTDQQWRSVNSYKNGSHNYHIAPNAISCILSQCHGWESPLGGGFVCALIEAAGVKLTNCEMEGSDRPQVVFLANDCEYHGGEVFAGFTSSTSVGIQLGQTAGNTPIPGQIKQSAGVTTAVQVVGTLINTKIDNCKGGAIDYQNEIYSDVTILNWANSGNVLKSGHAPNYLDRISHNVNGVTSDGSANTSPQYSWAGPGFNMFKVLGSDGTPILNANGTNNILSIANSAKLQGYSDYFSTQKFSTDMATGNIATSGNLAVGQSATAPALATAGTIATANLGVSRVAPTANVTGVILAAGTVAGQAVTVINESAFTITFAAVATSGVADGVSAIIAANRKMDFTWDSSTSKWYHS